ncbi:flavonoid 3',5'-methyltransferase-like [Amaranthus tricolor]|uniref:flavonoid 3',5'-methyltransferase-like n=1 Tax=Amaranthus tricolor TaxID=29722 RepID=UPI00258DBFCC|nr:flavonoid 3',5'-methyltransferase-like [Amaranthus tricolor]
MAKEKKVGKSILQSDALLEYILKTSAYPKEHEQLAEIRKVTVQKYPFLCIMNVSIDEAQFISLLLKLMNAKKTIELGVFTGYSLLTTALALPEDGKITSIDIDKEAYECGLPCIKKAGVEYKINFIQSDGITALNSIIDNGKEGGSYDFAFVDADKENYVKYHEKLLKLVKIGGLIAYDNTLWFGSVAHSEKDPYPIPKWIRIHQPTLLKFNEFLANDTRVESTILSLGDGLTLCRRLK